MAKKAIANSCALATSNGHGIPPAINVINRSLTMGCHPSTNAIKRSPSPNHRHPSAAHEFPAASQPGSVPGGRHGAPGGAEAALPAAHGGANPGGALAQEAAQLAAGATATWWMASGGDVAGASVKLLEVVKLCDIG